MVIIRKTIYKTESDQPKQYLITTIFLLGFIPIYYSEQLIGEIQ